MILDNYTIKYIEQFNNAFNVRIPLQRNQSISYLEKIQHNKLFIRDLTQIGEIIHGSFGFKGTCGLVHQIPGLMEKICFIAGAQRAYITIGCIHDIIKNITLFADFSKDEFVSRNKFKVKDNYHAWITLDSGEIIDLTFAASFTDTDYDFVPILGKPFQAQRFVYEPYMVNDIFPSLDTDKQTITSIKNSLCGPGWPTIMRQSVSDYLDKIKEMDPEVYSSVTLSFYKRFPQYKQKSSN